MNLQSHHTKEIDIESDYRAIIVCLITIFVMILIGGLAIYFTK